MQKATRVMTAMYLVRGHPVCHDYEEEKLAVYKRMPTLFSYLFEQALFDH